MRYQRKITVAALFMLVLPGCGERPPAATSETAVRAMTTTAVPATTEATSSATAPPATTAPAAVMPTGWVASGFDRAYSADGNSFPLKARHGLRSIVSNHQGGLIYVDDGGHIRELTPTGTSTLATLPEQLAHYAPVLELVSTNNARLLGFGTLEGVTWLNIETGAPSDYTNTDYQIANEFSLVTTIVKNGYTVVLTPFDYDKAHKSEGTPIPPFELAHLSIVDNTGNTVLDTHVGTQSSPIVFLHDFEGERLIVSHEPLEPAMAERSATLYELGCPDCTMTLPTNEPAQWYSLLPKRK